MQCPFDKIKAHYTPTIIGIAIKIDMIYQPLLFYFICVVYIYISVAIILLLLLID